MLVAVQSISWGADPDIDRMLREIVSAGYAGVELAQHPEALGSADALYGMLKNHRLRLVGVAGGSLQEKVDFLRRLMAVEQADVLRGGTLRDWRTTVGPAGRRPYVYIDEWNPLCVRQLASDTDIILALHPHMFKPVQTAAEAEYLLRLFPQLRFLPDTAHLVLTGDDACKVLERSFDRIDAVHLKNWSAVFGRAYQFYSRGFTSLDKEGDVPLNDVVKLLKLRGFSGWLVVEEDASPNPTESARQSRTWLRSNHGT